MFIMNLYAWRQRDPKKIPTNTIKYIGVDNDYFLEGISKRTVMTILAWGDPKTEANKKRISQVLPLLSNRRYLKLTAKENPANILVYLRRI